MLENGDYINIHNVADDVSIDVGKMKFCFHKITTQDNLFAFPGTKPYIVNLNQIECIVGEWNKEKTEYGLRIFYASGNSTWIGKEAAKGLLSYFKENIDEDDSSNLWTARSQFLNK